MDDKVMCSHCEKQANQDAAHPELKLISSIPESSIYRCSCCNAFWMHDSNGWENLDFDTLWDLAS